MESIVGPRSRDADTDSELDYPQQRGTYTPSAESLPSPRFGQSESSTPTFHEQQLLMGGEPYPTWTADKQIPISKEEVCLTGICLVPFDRRSSAPTLVATPHNRWKVCISCVKSTVVMAISLI